mmetsp:Transcript_2138/g.3090  ORF Transcript_2138/g.3090 Transcript_2138/m.3090 type:complete len:305 (+) Transcript_2138:478-1392(+)
MMVDDLLEDIFNMEPTAEEDNQSQIFSFTELNPNRKTTLTPLCVPGEQLKMGQYQIMEDEAHTDLMNDQQTHVEMTKQPKKLSDMLKNYQKPAPYTVHILDKDLADGTKVKILTQTRRDIKKPVPQTFYSCMEYHIFFDVQLFGAAMKRLCNNTSLFVKASLINESNMEIHDLHGCIETPLLNQGNGNLTANLKLKVGKGASLSYHQLKQTFQLRFDFTPSSTAVEPLLYMVTAPFKVYSRKPNPATTKKKKNSKQSRLTRFSTQLDSLLEAYEALPHVDQQERALHDLLMDVGTALGIQHYRE